MGSNVTMQDIEVKVVVFSGNFQVNGINNFRKLDQMLSTSSDTGRLNLHIYGHY